MSVIGLRVKGIVIWCTWWGMQQVLQPQDAREAVLYLPRIPASGCMFAKGASRYVLNVDLNVGHTTASAATSFLPHPLFSHC